MLLKSIFRKPAHKRTLGIKRQIPSMFTVVALTLGLIAAAPMVANANAPIVTRSGTDVTIAIDCNIAVDVYTRHNVNVYRGEKIRFTSKTGGALLCTNLTVRASDSQPVGGVATGIFAAPFPSTFTNIMLQQAPLTGFYDATVLADAPIGGKSKPLAITNAGTKGLMMFVTVVAPAPTVTSVAPNTGFTSGGTPITITGTNFAAGSTVTVGGVACTNVVVVSETTITCTTPATTVGAKNVVVNSAGQSATATGAFTYRAVASPPTTNTTDFYADLDGTSTWFESVATQGPIPSTGDFTLEFWVYDPSDRASTPATILSQAGSDANKTLEIMIDQTGKLDQELVIKYGGIVHDSLMKLPQDRWVNINIARSVDTLFLNFDGQEVFKVDTDVTSQEILGKLHVGQAGDGTQRFKGRIDQIKIWNGVMSGANLEKSMHTWGAQGVQTGLNLMAHYDFNDRTIAGGQVYNKVSNSHHLVLNAPAGTSPFLDVKQTISTSGKTTYAFPRTYLTQVGGWRLPNGVVAIQEALVVGGGGAGGYDGASGGGGGGAQFGSIPSIAANQVVSVKVGQGGAPGNFLTALQGTNGQSSSIAIPAREIATAAGGGRGSGSYGSTARGVGGSNSLFANFESYTGGNGGLGGDSTSVQKQGSAGTTLSSKFDQTYAFGGGGGAGIAVGSTQPTVDIAAAPGGTGGGGQGASVDDIGDGIHFCKNLTGKGASTGGNATPNTGGGGGGGTASGDACVASPNTRYDGERTGGGHGGAGVVIFGVTSPSTTAPAPTYTVLAQDNGTTALTVTWASMANAGVGLRKVVQYRVGNGSWFQVSENTTSSYSMPRTVNGVVEFRVSLFDEATEQWGEWVYSNQLTVNAYSGALCANPLMLRYDVTQTQTIVLAFQNSLTLPGISIRWGDGTGVAAFTATGGTPTARSKSFTTPGTYTIEVCGKFQRFTTNGLNLVEVVQWGEWVDNTGLTNPPARSLSLNEQNIDRSLSYPTRLTDVPATLPSTINSTVALFQGATVLNDPDIANWDVSNVTNMTLMFSSARDFNQDISAWNVTNVTDMRFMFDFARSFNQNISAWNTINVTGFTNMFRYASSYTHKPPIKIDKATDATGMLDFSGISDQTYSETIIDWSVRLAGSTRPAVLALGAADKTALCSVNRTIDSVNYTAVDRLLGLVAGGWTITDKTNRLTGHCATVITITAAPTTQVYGDPVPSVGFTPSVTGPRAVDPTWVDQVSCSVKLTSDANAVVSAQSPPASAGTYRTVCTGPATAGTGITVNYVPGTHTITKRPLAIKIKNRTERKGSTWTTATTSLSNSADLTEYAITGGSLVDSDQLSVTITKGSLMSGTQFNLGGALAAAGEHARYEVTFTSGVLTISDKTYVVTAKNRTKVYGDVLDPALDTVNGWTCQAQTNTVQADADCVTALKLGTVALSSGGTAADANVGTYSISSTFSASNATDYEVVNSNGGSITVTKRPLYVFPLDMVVNAGSATPTYTYLIENWGPGSDNENMAGFTAPTCTSGYTPNTPRGTELTITCSGGNPGNNYYFVFDKTATLTVPEITTVEDLTPEQATANPSTGMVTVPFAFNVTPFLNVCFATLIVTDLTAEGFETIERRVQVTSSDLRFELELPLGEYEYELLMDGNCSVESNPRSLTVAPQAANFQPVRLLPQPQSISPSVAKPNTRTRAQITGENLAQVVKVRIGGKTVKFVGATPTRLNFRIPKLKPGRYDILLVMRDGTTQRWQSQLLITGKAAVSSPSRTFIGFAAGSSRLTPAMRTAITRYLNTNKANYKTIECVGYTDGPFVRRTDVPLSMNRARVVCDLARSLGYEVVSRSYVNERTPGAELRRVKVILGK